MAETSSYLCGFAVPKQKTSDLPSHRAPSAPSRSRSGSCKRAADPPPPTAPDSTPRGRRSSRRRSLPPERFGAWHVDPDLDSDPDADAEKPSHPQPDPNTHEQPSKRHAESFEELTRHENFEKTERIHESVQALLHDASTRLPNEDEPPARSSDRRYPTSAPHRNAGRSNSTPKQQQPSTHEDAPKGHQQTQQRMEKQQQHPVHNERAHKQPTTSARSDSSMARTPLLQHDEKDVHERIRQSLSSHSAVRAHSAHKKDSQQQRTRQERKRQASQQVQRSEETHDVSTEPLAERCANVHAAKPASHQHQSADPQHVVAKETHEDCKRQIADAQTEVQNLRARLGASQDDAYRRGFEAGVHATIESVETHLHAVKEDALQTKPTRSA